MRIIAGYLGGRQIKTPRGHRTHPMADKVRGGLFNVLGDIEGLTVLDAFAGSGAVAFEAVSRGAASVVAIDIDRSAHSVIDQNVKDLKVADKVKPIRANAGGWSIHNMEKQFDIVILAPPYDNLQLNVLKTLAKRHVKPTGILVVDWPGKMETPEFEDLKAIHKKNYGDAQLIFYKP